MQARVAENDSDKKRKILKRKRQPTSADESNSEEFAVPSAKRSCQRRKKETLDACIEIHGGTKNNKAPVLDGLWLTLVKEAAPSQLANYLSKSKKALNKVVPKVVKEGVAKFEGSFENKLRSVRVLYSNGLLSKEKYKSVRLNMSTCFNSTSNKRASLKFMHDVPIPKLLSYPKLMQFVNLINTGNVKDFSDFCDLPDDQVNGSYRDLEEMLLELADMYVTIDKKTPFLLNFGESLWHFRVALGADGAPFGKDDEATSWLLSFLNVGERIASCNENFLLCGANCSESHPSMIKFAKNLISDVAHIEKQIYVLPASKTKAKFTVELIPSDMKWAATFSGELSNAAHFFSTFGNVSESDKFTLNGCLGPAETCTWKPWLYKDRLEVAAKVTAKKAELERTSLAESTKRSKVLNYIQSLNSRQEYAPVLKGLVDKIYAEPLHNANNGWQQLHALILGHANDKSAIPSTCTDVSKMPDCPLASHLITLKQIGASRLFKKVKKWFCQGRKGTLSYRFTGKETRIMCQNFMKLVKAVSSEQDTPVQSLQINTFAFVGLQLRVATSRFSRVNIDQELLQELKDSCEMYFNACSLLLGSVTPTVWTIGHAIPFHTEILFKKFGLGLGMNSMQGREAKHVRIAQYAKHATLSSRWVLVFRHDYITGIWLRTKDPSSVPYHKNKEVYEPGISNEFCHCGLEKVPGGEKCEFCSSALYRSVERSAQKGELDPYLANLLSVLS